VLLVAGLQLALTTPSAVATGVPDDASSAPVDVATPTPVDLGVFSGPVRFEAPDGTVLDLGERRYVGTLEAAVDDRGLSLVDELSFDAYLEGLAEVPIAWHPEALRAQVVAARTYAWWEYSAGIWRDRGYDVCATQACQVFAGRDIMEVDREGRWRAAVADTSGAVLLDPDGAPILARYSSSNGGASLANHEVFPSDGEYPWLQPVLDGYDAVSPFHGWRVVFPRDVFDRLVAAGATLGPASPVADVRLVEVEDAEDLVEVTGEDGVVRSVTTSAFRRFVSAVAPDLDPAAYPPPRPDAPGSRQPTTLLSGQLAFTVTDDDVVIDGRGFGHAVGMSQYGALGRAQAGIDHPAILAHYYGGIEPTIAPDLPASLRVGLADGAQEVVVRPDGPVTVRVGGTLVTDRGLGTWRVEALPDRTLRLVAPAGYGAPLVVDRTVVVEGPVATGAAVLLETVVNKSVQLTAVAVGDDGAEVAREALGVVEAGRRTVAWTPLTAAGEPLPVGGYDVTLVATDEAGATAGSPAPLEIVVADPVPGVAELPVTPADGTGSPWSLVGMLVAAAALALVTLAGLRRTRSRGRP
jgi:stage II sporulation protein D